MDAIETLMNEHRIIERVIDALIAFADETAPQGRRGQGGARAVRHLHPRVRRRASTTGRRRTSSSPRWSSPASRATAGPVGVMLAEHDAGRRLVGDPRRARRAGDRRVERRRPAVLAEAADGYGAPPPRAHPQGGRDPLPDGRAAAAARGAGARGRALRTSWTARAPASAHAAPRARRGARPCARRARHSVAPPRAASPAATDFSIPFPTHRSHHGEPSSHKTRAILLFTVVGASPCSCSAARRSTQNKPPIPGRSSSPPARSSSPARTSSPGRSCTSRAAARQSARSGATARTSPPTGRRTRSTGPALATAGLARGLAPRARGRLLAGRPRGARRRGEGRVAALVKQELKQNRYDAATDTLDALARAGGGVSRRSTPTTRELFTQGDDLQSLPANWLEVAGGGAQDHRVLLLDGVGGGHEPPRRDPHATPRTSRTTRSPGTSRCRRRSSGPSSRSCCSSPARPRHLPVD